MLLESAPWVRVSVGDICRRPWHPSGGTWGDALGILVWMRVLDG
jgi:hypothetical protein